MFLKFNKKKGFVTKSKDSYGERGIRTLGMGFPYDALAMRYLRPLGHLSLVLTISKKIVSKLTREINVYVLIKIIF